MAQEEFRYTSTTQQPLWQRVVMGVVAVAGAVALLWRLEINGWPSLLWVVTLFGIAIVRAPFERRTAENTITYTEAEKTERVLLALVGIGSSAVPFVHLVTGIFSFANYRLSNGAVLFGVGLLLVGFWMFWRSHKDLGRNWSVTTELREDHSLTTTGVYARIRHPMYTAIALLFASQAFFVQNAIAGVSGLAAFIVMLVLRIPYEESMMRKQFGAAYDAYVARTGRLLPKL
ncbi:MAG: protein-S-isoprenylcysteine O-methyltransferase [Pseudomonadota bacterium]